MCANVKVEGPGAVSDWLPQTFRANERGCRCLNLAFFLTPTHTGKKTVSTELSFINVISVCVAETSPKALSLGAIVLEHI